jgi:hypothetical protein
VRRKAAAFFDQLQVVVKAMSTIKGQISWNTNGPKTGKDKSKIFHKKRMIDDIEMVSSF